MVAFNEITRYSCFHSISFRSVCSEVIINRNGETLGDKLIVGLPVVLKRRELSLREQISVFFSVRAGNGEFITACYKFHFRDSQFHLAVTWRNDSSCRLSLKHLSCTS